MDAGQVDWTQVGEWVGTVLLAGGAAWAGARRVLRKGLAELLRPVVQAELSNARKQLGTVVRESVKDGLAEAQEDLRTTMREELREIRQETGRLAREMDDVQQRVAHTEGVVDTLQGLLTGKRPDKDKSVA